MLYRRVALMVLIKLPQIKMAYPKVKGDASEEEEVAEMRKTKLEALWDKVRWTTSIS